MHQVNCRQNSWPWECLCNSCLRVSRSPPVEQSEGILEILRKFVVKERMQKVILAKKITVNEHLQTFYVIERAKDKILALINLESNMTICIICWT